MIHPPSSGNWPNPDNLSAAIIMDLIAQLNPDGIYESSWFNVLQHQHQANLAIYNVTYWANIECYGSTKILISSGTGIIIFELAHPHSLEMIVSQLKKLLP